MDIALRSSDATSRDRRRLKKASNGLPRILLSASTLAILAAADLVRCGDDVVLLKDGSTLQGVVTELGGNRIDLVLPGGSKKLLKRDIEHVTFDSTRPLSKVEDSDGVVKPDGHIVRGKVDVLENGQKVKLTLPNGGTAVYARKDIARIIRKGDSIQADSSVFTVELSAAMDLALDKLRSAPDADMEAYLKRCGILAIDRVRAALASLPQDSPARPALSRIDHVYRLKETVAAEIEDAEPKVYDILSSGTTEQRCDLLLFIFPRFVEESVPLAEFLALDTNMEPTIRSWSVDFLRRLQKNRELLRVYKLSSGQGQLAAAIALGQNRILVGIPTLIEALELESIDLRTLASSSLKEFTGQDFQFRPDGAPQARREAVARWRAWWQRNDKQMLDAAQSLIRLGDEGAPILGGSPTKERLDAIKLWTEAGLAYDGKRYPEAEALLRKALDKDATFYQAYQALAVVLYTGTGKAPEAVKLLEGLKTKRLPGVTQRDRQWLFIHLGNAMRIAGDLDGAFVAYQEARSLSNKNLQALKGVVETAYSQATSNVALSADERKSKLHAALDAGKAALQLIDEANQDLVTLRFDSVTLSDNFSFDRREYNRSILSLRKAFRREKKETQFRIGRILAVLDDKKEAILTLRSAIEDHLIDADNSGRTLEADIRCFLGLLYEDLNQPLAALREYRKVLDEVEPGHAECSRAVERLRRKAGEKAGN